MATIKEELLVLGIRQIAVTYGKLPSRNSRWPLRVAAALVWQGALSSSPSLTPFLESIEYNIILATSCSYVISPYVTNNYTSF